MGNGTCLESQRRVCKAYITDCYSHLAKSYHKCNAEEREALKMDIVEMLDKVKQLITTAHAD